MNTFMNNSARRLIHATVIGFCLWVSTASTSASATTAPAYENTRLSLAPLIHKTMKENKIVGLSIALVDDQTVVWSQGYGFADQAQGLKATPQTLYRAGSISKLFTATAAMQLAEQGRFDIDRPLQSYLPDYSIKTRFPSAGPITPRQLMTHHSGLPGDYLKGAVATIPLETLAGLPHKLLNEYTAYPPNFILSYSNLGVALLGDAIENVCGAEFGECLKTYVLQQLGMDASEFASGPSASALMSQGYSNGVAMTEPYLRDIPAGGLNSNVLDLSRFMKMVFADGGTVISSATLAEMLRPQNADVPLDLGQRIGLAWVLTDLSAGETVAWHNGGIGNFHSFLGILPGHKLGVVLLANSDTAAGVVEQLGMTALRLMLAEKSGDSLPVQDKPVTGEAKAADSQDFPGYYASEEFGLIAISGKQAPMQISLNGQTYPLTPHADGRLVVNSPELGKALLSRATLSGRQVLISESPGKKQLLAEKIAPAPLPAIWRQRVGKYRLRYGKNEIRDALSYQLEIQHGFLVLSRLDAPRVLLPLLPVSESEAIIAGLGRSLGETIAFASQDGVNLLRYSGFLAKSK